MELAEFHAEKNGHLPVKVRGGRGIAPLVHCFNPGTGSDVSFSALSKRRGLRMAIPILFIKISYGNSFQIKENFDLAKEQRLKTLLQQRRQSQSASGSSGNSRRDSLVPMSGKGNEIFGQHYYYFSFSLSYRRDFQ